MKDQDEANTLARAMTVVDPDEASALLSAYVREICESESISPDEALEKAKKCMGYYAGYYDWETRERVERLFGAVHPIFGPVEVAKHLTLNQIFRLGMELGRKDIGKA